MMKVLVTGATGFLGYHVISSLLKHNVEVIALAIDSDASASVLDWYTKVTYIQYDFTKNNKNAYDVLGSPDILIHLAWKGLPNYSEEYHISVNQNSSFEFISYMVNSGLRSVAVSGTCFEYGNREGCLSEEMDVVPMNNYGIAKNKLRLQLEQIQHINLTWARFFYIYGFGQSKNSLLGQLQQTINNKEQEFNMSPGDQLRDFIDVEEAAELFVRLALNGLDNGVVNVCSGKPISVLSFVEKQLEKMGADIKLNAGFYPYSKFEPKDFWGDTNKLQSLLSKE